MIKNKLLIIIICILLRATIAYAELPAQVWWSGYAGDTGYGVMWDRSGSDKRFTDNADGTVDDNLTGLTWLHDGGCLGKAPWDEALNKILDLNNGLKDNDCGLTANPGTWRLPNKIELYSLIDYGKTSGIRIGYTGTEFEGVRSDFPYWTSTSFIYDTDNMAWTVNMSDGKILPDAKTESLNVWAVSGGIIPGIAVTPDTHDFGTVSKDGSVEKSFIIMSDGLEDLKLEGITIEGTDFSEFIITADTCSNQTLTTGETCSLTVKFNPQSVGAKSAYVSIPTNIYYYYDPVSGEKIKTVDLSGTGTVQLTVHADEGNCNGAGRITATGIDCGVNVDGGTDCSEIYSSASSVVLTATGEFDSWEGDCSVANGTSCTINSMDSNKTVTAKFKEKFNIFAYVRDGDEAMGDISPEGQQNVYCGDTPTFTCIPKNVMYEVDTIKVDKIEQEEDSETYTFDPIDANHSITCGFKIKEFTITASVEPEEGGTITPSGDVSVQYNGEQNFVIEPNGCYEIEDVIIDGVSMGPLSSYKFDNVQEPHTIVAQFKKRTFTITTIISPKDMGVINPKNPAVECGLSQEFTVTPNTDYHIKEAAALIGVLVPQDSQGCSIKKYILENITEDNTVTVTLSEGRINTLESTAGEGGTIEPSGIICVSEGESQNFKIQPDVESGWCLDNVRVCQDPEGSNVCEDLGGEVYNYTFSDVANNWTIEAMFNQPPGGCDLPVITPSIIMDDGQACSDDCGSINPSEIDEFGIIPGDNKVYTIIAREDNDFYLNKVEVCDLDDEGTPINCFNPPIEEASSEEPSVKLAQDESLACVIAAVQPDDGSRKYECTFYNVLTDHTINAVMTHAPSYEITATFDACGNSGITYSGNGEAVAQDETSVTIRILEGGSEAVTCVADESSGCGLSSVTIDGELLENLSPLYQIAFNHNFVNLNSDHTIHCGVGITDPLPVIHTITSSVNADNTGQGIIIPSGDIPVFDGGAQDFVIIPAEGYQVADVKIDGISVGPVKSYTFVNITSDHQIEVTFSEAQFFTITSSTSVENGSIVPEGETALPYWGAQEYTMACPSGSYVDSVEVDGQSVGAPLSYSFINVNTDHSIMLASCTEGAVDVYAITTSIEPLNEQKNGNIFPTGNDLGIVSVIGGQNQTFIIKSDFGYHIADVMVDGESVGAVSQYTFEDVTEDHTIRAFFALGSSMLMLGDSTSLNPETHDFGDVDISSSVSHSFIIYNVGSSIININNFTIDEITDETDPPAEAATEEGNKEQEAVTSEFTIPDETNNCQNKALAPSEVCTFDVQFTPGQSDVLVEKKLSIVTSSFSTPQLTTKLKGNGLLVGTRGSEFTLAIDEQYQNLLAKKPKAFLIYNKNGKQKKKKLKVLNWNDKELNLLVKKKVQVEYNPYKVLIKFKGGQKVEFSNFYVRAAKIDDGEPIKCKSNDQVKITGDMFGSKKKKVLLFTPGMKKPKKCKVQSWTMDPKTGRSEITFKVKKKLGPGEYNVIVDNKATNTPSAKEKYIIIE
jgi:hypothetical protein